MKTVEPIGETMTVGELITELQKFNQELPVLTEGCDCYGNCIGFKILPDKKGDVLLIERNN